MAKEAGQSTESLLFLLKLSVCFSSAGGGTGVATDTGDGGQRGGDSLQGLFSLLGRVAKS
jgi:hypothetical protein